MGLLGVLRRFCCALPVPLWPRPVMDASLGVLCIETKSSVAQRFEVRMER